MFDPDIEFVKNCIAGGLVKSPCLELGAGYDGPNNRKLIEQAGVAYFATDIHPDSGVDYVVNFDDPPEFIEQSVGGKKFGSSLCLNVLEHTFDPIRVLDNIFTILRPDGACLITTPTVWPLHNYPMDCWRINPDFYVEYCRRRGLALLDEYFVFLSGRGEENVEATRQSNGTYVLPSPWPNKFSMVRSKLIHKLFDTPGRGMLFPSHVSTAVVIQKPNNEAAS